MDITLERIDKDNHSATYKEKETGQTIKITSCAEPWTWSVATTSEFLKKNSKKIIEAYVDKALK